MQPGFPSPWYPWSNYLCLAFLALILVVIGLTPGIRTAVFIIPVWLLLIWVGYKLTHASRVRRAELVLNQG